VSLGPASTGAQVLGSLVVVGVLAAGAGALAHGVSKFRAMYNKDNVDVTRACEQSAECGHALAHTGAGVALLAVAAGAMGMVKGYTSKFL
jgi:hypothetical protein